MSADNWSVCPKCKKSASEKEEARLIHLGEAYGVMPKDEYLKLAAQSPPKLSWDAQHQLREDYEVRMSEDGVFSISYGCSCYTCGFSFSYKYEEQIVA